MSPPQLVDLFVELFPQFRRAWDDENNNMNRNGDDFTAHGVCAEFSHFYIENGLGADSSKLDRLFEKIEEIVACDPEDKDPVANALCTCFLENIAQTPAGEGSIGFMRPESLKFFRFWHVER
jgi:hypothetical protein